MSNLAKINSFLYEKIFRRSSTFAIFIGVSAIFLDRAVDGLAESIFANINQGRLWKDVKRQLKLEGTN